MKKSIFTILYRISHLVMEAKYIANLEAWCTQNPNQRVAENRLLTNNFNIKEAKFTVKRLKRMQLYLLYLNQMKNDIFKYKYPKFSNLCFLLCILIVFLYNPNQFLCNLMVILFILFGINNPYLRRKIDPIVKLYFFRDDLMNPYARQNIQTLKEFEDEQLMRKIYDKKETKSKAEKDAEKLKKKEWLYKNLKRNYLSILHMFVKIADVLEKIKK